MYNGICRKNGTVATSLWQKAMTHSAYTEPKHGQWLDDIGYDYMELYAVALRLQVCI